MQLSDRISPDSKVPSIATDTANPSHLETPHPIANTPDNHTRSLPYFLAPARAFFPSLSSISLSSPSPFPRFFFIPARAVALVGVAFPLPSLPKLAEMGVGAPEGVVWVDSPPGESYQDMNVSSVLSTGSSAR